MSYAETDRIYKPMHAMTTSARVKMAVQENDIVANALARAEADLDEIKRNNTRAGDVREIENLMSAQFYLSYANRRKELLDNYWSARDDIAYGMEDRACIGRDAVYQYYVDAYGEAQAARSGGAGDMTLDLSTSPYIEVAQDGQTAQGIVITMSYRADAGVTDHIRSRFGFDFVKENGVWKIWHLRQLADISLPCTPADPAAARAQDDKSAYPASNGPVAAVSRDYLSTAPVLPHDLPQAYACWQDDAVTDTPLTKRVTINIEEVGKALHVPQTEPPLPPGMTPPPGMPKMLQSDWGTLPYLSLGAEEVKKRAGNAGEVAFQGSGASWIFTAFAAAVSPAVPCIYVPPLNDYVRVRPLPMGDDFSKESGIVLNVVETDKAIMVHVHEAGTAKDQRELSRMISNAVLPVAAPGKDVYLTGMMPNFVAVAIATGYSRAGARTVNIKLATENAYTCCISNDPEFSIGTKSEPYRAF